MQCCHLTVVITCLLGTDYRVFPTVSRAIEWLNYTITPSLTARLRDEVSCVPSTVDIVCSNPMLLSEAVMQNNTDPRGAALHCDTGHIHQ